MEKYLQQRLYMVESQLAARGISSPRVLEAMRRVPRHLFVPSHLESAAYSDTPLPIGEGQTISQPFIVALMAQLAEVQPHARVLEIGTGSGYGAAVLAEIADAVYTVERLPELAKRAEQQLAALHYKKVSCLVGDGSLGWPQNAPYDAIVVTAGAPIVPSSLRTQLAVGGSLVIPVGDAILQELKQIKRLDESHYSENSIEGVRFVPLIGSEAWP